MYTDLIEAIIHLDKARICLVKAEKRAGDNYETLSKPVEEVIADVRSVAEKQS